MHATVPHAKACLNAGLLDALEPGTKIGGVAGHRDEMVERKRSHPDPKKVTSAFTGRSFQTGPIGFLSTKLTNTFFYFELFEYLIFRH